MADDKSEQQGKLKTLQTDMKAAMEIANLASGALGYMTITAKDIKKNVQELETPLGSTNPNDAIKAFQTFLSKTKTLCDAAGTQYDKLKSDSQKARDAVNKLVTRAKELKTYYEGKRDNKLLFIKKSYYVKKLDKLDKLSTSLTSLLSDIGYIDTEAQKVDKSLDDVKSLMS